ncbi:MAG: dihydropyrimidine dehydrogenase, partial [Candidatus Riflebacteria bacterium]|nr:dihydropyrimidine dehydrogenase [Candidatus Riflebacteria bacterium]
MTAKRVEPPRLPPAERIKTFDEIERTLPAHQAFKEAARCLFCHDAPCNKVCPVEVDVVSFIRKLKTKNFTGAIRVIREGNPLAATCARVCPQASLCEGGCAQSELAEPIAVGALQRFLADEELKKGIAPMVPAPPTGRKVAVVGAGPAGLTCA